ncbi:MAG: insulinase family protein [Planctomycetota bacterium]|nr:MAG: insulinase family protein [Planctomycetota bacterium]
MMRPKRLLIAALIVAMTGISEAAKLTPPTNFPDQPPVGKLLKPTHLPKAFSKKLENGMEVLVIANHEIPYVSVGWYLLTGAKVDPPQKAGLADTTASLLKQGTTEHSPDQFTELLELYAISFSSGAGHETSYVHVGTMNRHLDRAVQMMAEAIRRPIFDKNEFRRYIQQVLTDLAVAEKEGSYLASREFERRIYGNHYLARPSEGTTETIKKIKHDDLAAFHKKNYLPNQSLLIFSGAVTNQLAVELAEKYFGDWKRGSPVQIPKTEFPKLNQTTIFLVDRPDATQTQIRIGLLGFTRNHPAYITSQVFNQIFGSGFSSRLNKRVRIKEGLTYGIWGSFSAGKQPGRLNIGTYTQNQQTAKTLRIILEEIERMRTDPPNTEELGDAQSYLIGRFGLSMETPQAVAGKVFELKFYDLPDDYFDTYLDQIVKVDAEGISGFAKAKIDSNKLVIVLVGKAQDFEDHLKDIAPVIKVNQEQTVPQE